MADKVKEKDPTPVNLGAKLSSTHMVSLVILYKNRRKMVLKTALGVASQIQMEFRNYLNRRNLQSDRKHHVEEAIAFIGENLPEYFLTIDASAVETMYVEEAFQDDAVGTLR